MIENHVHTHVDENGKPHTHTHQHPHEQTKAVLNRISRAQGHLEAVRRMVERGEDCAQVLVQLSAVISALNSPNSPSETEQNPSQRLNRIQSGSYCRTGQHTLPLYRAENPPDSSPASR